MIGSTVSHYEIVEKLGEGGMGVVYKARDTKLERFVALKFLPPGVASDDPEHARFLQEARAASALDHPNICTIHDIEKTADGRTFIVMACYDGETLRARMQRGPMAVGDVLSIGRQVAQGLGRAHERGIVHRDVKPANIFITTDGTVKVLDFGIARLLDETHLQMTRAGTTVGTVGYMAPEQTRGEEVDRRADVWALGVILHEMLTGKPAFDGSHPNVIMQAIQTREPESLERSRPDAPAALVQLIGRALKKDRSQRFADADALAAAIASVESSLRDSTVHVPVVSALRRPMLAIPLGVSLLLLVTTSAWLMYKANRSSWARNTALPEIAKLATENKFAEAVDLASRAEPYLPGDPVLARLWTDIAILVTLDSTPAGALVEARPYADAAAPWRPLGTTPISRVRVPRGVYRWRFSKTGSTTVESAAPAVAAPFRMDLPPAGSVPDGFVKIPKGPEALMVADLGLPESVIVDDYFIQRYEVTNRDFKKFVDAGGYRRKEFWRQEFQENGRALTWEEGMSRLRDRAGQPGPATWEVGAYPAGQDTFPVSGVSWYEAAAYAAFAGLSLPTVHHWYRAAGMTSGPFLIPLSNFDYRGPRAVEDSGAMSPSGVFDMAGNVKEWVWNADDAGGRYTLGGGWGEPAYMFGSMEPRSPFDRPPTIGFRLVKYAGDGRADAKSAAPLQRQVRDYTKEKPVGDAMFAQFQRLLKYAPKPLDANTDKTIDSDPEIRVERVSFTAAYSGDRVIAYVWLPKKWKPPYQTLVVFPGSEMLQPQSSASLEQPARYDFLVRSGRAVIYPMYYGTYDRFQPIKTDPIARRDEVIRWIQDFRRTLDYLATRPEIDSTKIGYFGLSLGGGLAPLMLAGEPRLKTAVLMGAGLVSIKYEPEVEPVNYLPRVTQPVLMVNGLYDYFIPHDPAQIRFFELLGSAPHEKVHHVVDAPHSVPRALYLPPVLGWLDKYLGPAR